MNIGDKFNAASTSKVLDFGELTVNEEMSFVLILLSNAGDNSSISSANNQVMQFNDIGQFTSFIGICHD